MFKLSVWIIGLAVAGCSDWPDVPDSASSEPLGPWPTLQPIDGTVETVSASDPEFEIIDTRAARLRARASVLRTPVQDQASFDRLRARMAQ